MLRLPPNGLDTINANPVRFPDDESTRRPRRLKILKLADIAFNYTVITHHHRVRVLWLFSFLVVIFGEEIPPRRRRIPTAEYVTCNMTDDVKTVH